MHAHRRCFYRCSAHLRARSHDAVDASAAPRYQAIACARCDTMRPLHPLHQQPSGIRLQSILCEPCISHFAGVTTPVARSRCSLHTVCLAVTARCYNGDAAAERTSVGALFCMAGLLSRDADRELGLGEGDGRGTWGTGMEEGDGRGREGPPHKLRDRGKGHLPVHGDLTF